MDQFALAEGDSLLGGSTNHTAIEMSGMGGRFQVEGEKRWCATAGAAMQMTVNTKPVPWRSSFELDPGDDLRIGAVAKGSSQGSYGYLFIAGGFCPASEIGAIGTHLRAGIGGLDGGPLRSGNRVPIGTMKGAEPREHPQRLPDPDHLGRQRIRIVWGAQSGRFNEVTRRQLLERTYRVSHRRDRMAMRLELAAGDDAFESLLGGLSDPIQAGDIQMTGDGMPAILMREHQPTGGYPRIASVISADLDAAAQLQTGMSFQFELVSLDQAVVALEQRQQEIQSLDRKLGAVVRSAEQIGNLLDYNLIDGVVSASNEPLIR